MNNQSCTFYDKSFVEDLYPFDFKKLDENFIVDYQIDNQFQSYPLVLNLKNISLESPNNSNTWYPIFINQTQSNLAISNKYLFGASIDSPNLGIEDVVSFAPSFVNWTTTGEAKMSIDWILTSVITPFIPEYGLLCWSKNTFSTSKDLTIYDIPYNTIVYATKDISYEDGNNTINITTEMPLIKKSDNELLILNKDKIINTSANILPTDNSIKYISLDKLKISKDRIFFTTKISKSISHISAGESYSYFDSSSTKIFSIQNNIPSKTYISPILNNIYRQIYHCLTLRYPKKIDVQTKIPESIFNRNQWRKFKKICCMLSTHPQIDRTTVSILDNNEIYHLINEYVKSDEPYKNEMKILTETLTKIGKFFDHIAINDSIYYDDMYVPKKLLEKYGAKLRFASSTGDSTLVYKHPLPDGPHVKVSSDIRSLCQKNLSKAIVYNNVKIKAGPFVAETIIDESQCQLKLNTTFDSETSNIIPLWDIRKIKLINEKAEFTVGPDLNIDLDNLGDNQQDFELIVKPTRPKPTDTPGDLELVIRLKSKLLFELRDSALAGTTISFKWSKIFGPDCLKFSNFSITDIDSNGIFPNGSGDRARFNTSSDESPNVYIKKPGKYIIECQIDTGRGIVSDTVNIYVTSANLYAKETMDPVRPERKIDLLSPDRNAVMVSNFRSFIFGKQGIFWPLYSDLSILEPKYISKSSDSVAGLQEKVRLFDDVVPLGAVSNKFAIPYSKRKAPKNINNDSRLSFDFKSKNTIIELSQISLAHIHSTEHPHCETIYRETFDNQLSDLELSASQVIVDPLSKKDIDIYRPNKIAVTGLELNSESEELLRGSIFGNSEPKDTPLKFDGYTYEADIYGNPSDGANDRQNIVCYETIPNNEEFQKLQESTYISMERGYFHPNSGWISQQTKDKISPVPKTAIMTGDPTKKYCKTFRGLGFDELKNDFIDEKVKIYSSTIKLAMSEAAYDCADCEDEADRLEHEKGESDDHNTNYGYRDLSSSTKSLYRINDEYGISAITTPDGLTASFDFEYCTKNIMFDNQKPPADWNLPDEAMQSSNDNADNFVPGQSTNISYIYPKPGPIAAPSSLNNRPKFRFSRGPGRAIGDISVKLNFLNYPNPKELVIWLEIDPPSDVQVKTTRTGNNNSSGSGSGSSRQDILYYSSLNRAARVKFMQESIHNIHIKEYMQQLFKLNDNKYKAESSEIPAAPMDLTDVEAVQRLFLLNQDHIEASTYNNILKFTDHTNKTIDTNIREYITNNVNKHTNNNGIVELRPTLSAPGYNDLDSIKYTNIIMNNNLLPYSISTFNKLKNMPLFSLYIDPETRKPPPQNSSFTSFTLKIAVIGESDDGQVYDRVLSTDNMMNINNIAERPISNISSNSLCSWDLILSDDDNDALNFEDTDVLGHINYKEDPKYYGYNFIGKIPPHLIPPVNINAPNISLLNNNLCFYSKEKLTAPGLVDSPSLNVSPLMITPFWSIVGAVSSVSSVMDQMNIAAAAYWSYFNDLRRIRFAELFDREIYMSNYMNYPVGRPYKALISISKDNIVWFKLEAGIFRYNNCPIFKQKKYSYHQIDYTNEFRDLAKFPISVLEDPLDFIKPYVRELEQFSGDPESDYDDIAYIIKTSFGPNQYTFIEKVKNVIATINNQIEKYEKELSTPGDSQSQADQDLDEFTIKRINKQKRELEIHLNLLKALTLKGDQEDDIIVVTGEGLPDPDTGVKKREYEYINIRKIVNKNISNEDFWSKDTLTDFQSLDLDANYISSETDLQLDNFLKNNDIFFINSNLLSIIPYLNGYSLPRSRDIDNPIQNNNKHIIFLKGLRPFYIYEVDKDITIFKPIRGLTISVNREIERLKQEINKLSDPKNPEKNKAQKILDLENKIFNLEHTKYTAKIKAKGIQRTKNILNTVLVLDQNLEIDDSCIAVITPEQNRVIVCDTSYKHQDNETQDLTGYSQWSFINDNNQTLSKPIPHPDKTVFNNGSYGSGSVNNLPKKIFSPVIVNYIKSFFEYLEIKRYNYLNFKEECKIFSNPDAPDKFTSNNLYNIFSINKLSDDMRKYMSINQLPENTSDTEIMELLSILTKTDEFGAYFKQYNLSFFMEGTLDKSTIRSEQDDDQDNNASQSKNYGKIILNNLINSNTTIYKLKNHAEIKILKDRIQFIPKEIEKLNTQLQKDQSKLKQDAIIQIKDTISNLNLEYNKLSFYLEKLEEITDKTNYEDIYPNIFVKIITNEDKSLTIEEISNDDDYFINIDAEQGCSLDLDKMPKILTKIEYQCLSAVGTGSSTYYYVDPYRFCGESAGSFTPNLEEGSIGDMYKLKVNTRLGLEYTILPKKLEEIQAKYSVEGLSWDTKEGARTISSERSFFLHGNEGRSGIVKARYEYLVAAYKNPVSYPPEGVLNNKVKDIFNLDDVTQLTIDFKKIPRNLRNVDNLYDKYIPTANGILVKSLTPSPGGPIDTTFKIWQCYNAITKESASLPSNMKWLNLMKYLAYYSTYLIDNPIFDINNGLLMVKTKDEMGLVPYDYQ